MSLVIEKMMQNKEEETHHMHIPYTHPVGVETFDPRAEETAQEAAFPNPLPSPVIDYMAKDYASFRQMLMGRLAVSMPGFNEQNPADQQVMLTEILAYAGDYLAYFQDVVGTETYLATARSRISVKRHVRLLNHYVHEGCNARLWVQLVNLQGAVHVSAGTMVLSTLEDRRTSIPSSEALLAEILTQQVSVFETMHDITLHASHSCLQFYCYGMKHCLLPEGATEAVLKGHFPHLRAGDVLILEEVRNPETGRASDASPVRRHPVRLTSSCIAMIKHEHVTKITWHTEDALPFSQIIVNHPVATESDPCAVFCGNIVLADQGLTAEFPGFRTEGEDAIPLSMNRQLVFREPYLHETAMWSSAKKATVQSPEKALPAVALYQGREQWLPVRDLLDSGPETPDFTVDVEENGQAAVRFGSHGYGRTPAKGAHFRVIARTSAPGDQKAGQGSISHVVTSVLGIASVRNMLPATGAKPRESTLKARSLAPKTYGKRQSCYTAEEYAARVRAVEGVSNVSVAIERSMGGRQVFLYVQPNGNRLFGKELETEIIHSLAPYRFIGDRLVVRPPYYVPLALRLVVTCQANYAPDSVKKALEERFGTTFSRNDATYFSADHFSFGDSLYFSSMVETALTLTGVARIDITDPRTCFRHVNEHNSRMHLREGRIAMPAHAILQIDGVRPGGNRGYLEWIVLPADLNT